MSETKNDVVPLVDLVGQYRNHKDEIDQAIRGIIETGAFIGGAALSRFEANFAKFCGVKHCIGVANGTDALYLALRMAGIKPGDEVLIPVNTFIATGEAVTLAGAKPVFVDIVEETSLIDLGKAEKAITPRTRAIIPVHLYGQLLPMNAFMEFAQKHDLLVVEDACQAHGAEFGGKKAGSFGKAGCFSFYPGKNLGAYGDGGAVITDDDQLADKIRRIANHGRAEKYGHDMEGVNSRLDGLQAAILDVKLKHLPAWTEARRAVAKRYEEALRGIPNVRTPGLPSDLRTHVFHLYVIRVPAPMRDPLKKHLDSRNIQAGVHYPIPLHEQVAYRHLGIAKGAFPVAEKLAPEILSLPLSPETSVEQTQRVASAIREFMTRS